MKVLLKNVRIAFCQSLTEPEQYQGKGVFRHSATYLIEPGSVNDKAVESAIRSAAAEKWPKKATAMVESMRGNSNKFCYQKGDLKEYDGFQGMLALAGHRKQQDGQPLLLDTDKTPLTGSDGKWLKGKEARIYGGCYVNASVDIYAQDGENSGIRCSLVGVQFFKDGDSFGGAAKSSGDEFEDLGTGADADFEESLV